MLPEQQVTGYSTSFGQEAQSNFRCSFSLAIPGWWIIMTFGFYGTSKLASLIMWTTLSFNEICKAAD